MPYMGDISMCKDKHKTDHVFFLALFWPLFRSKGQKLLDLFYT